MAIEDLSFHCLGMFD